MPFRFAGRYALLTYAQCADLDAFEVVNHLARLGAECIVGREDHADGGVHLHAFVDFGRKFQSRNERVFDVGGRHPNVLRGTRTPEKMYDYAIKDGEVVAGGLERPSGTGVSETSSVWAKIILAETRDEFFGLISELDPRSMCVNFGSIRSYAEWRYRESRDPYRTPEGVQICTDQVPELNEWVQRNLVGSESGGESCPSRTWHPHSLCSFSAPRRGPRHVLSRALFFLVLTNPFC